MATDWLSDGAPARRADPETELRFPKDEPDAPPADPGLHDPSIRIDVGAACLNRRMGATDGDRRLVASVGTAGGICASSGNRWRIRSTGNPVDRAAEARCDACFVFPGWKRTRLRLRRSQALRGVRRRRFPRLAARR